MGTQTSFKANGASTLGYEAVPKSGKGPGVIVLQEWWGLVPHIKNLCDRFAAEGFVALSPDLYHGEMGKSPDEAGRLMMALDIDRAAQDLDGAIAHLLAHPQNSAKSVGVVGFCMGGQLALYAASQSPKIGACVDFYGVHPKVQPNFSKVSCPVLGFFGAKDASVTPEVARRLESGLQAHGVKTDFTVFPEAGHAFFNDSRPDAYNKEAAQKCWDKLLSFFRTNLK